MVDNVKPINIFVKFPSAPEVITGQGEMKMVMNEGAPFFFLLNSIFISYPEIQRRYPPGKLAFRLNNRRPTEHELLHEGDQLIFYI